LKQVLMVCPSQPIPPHQWVPKSVAILSDWAVGFGVAALELWWVWGSLILYWDLQE
jgi:hypothetical protein